MSIRLDDLGRVVVREGGDGSDSNGDVVARPVSASLADFVPGGLLHRGAMSPRPDLGEGVYDIGGRRWQVRSVESRAHAQNEVAAAALYPLWKVDVLETRVVRLDGALGANFGVAVEYVDNLEVVSVTPELPGVAAIRRAALVDALLDNWSAPDRVKRLGDRLVRTDLHGALWYDLDGRAKRDAFGFHIPQLTISARGGTGITENIPPAMLMELLEFVTSVQESQIRATLLVAMRDPARAIRGGRSARLPPTPPQAAAGPRNDQPTHPHPNHPNPTHANERGSGDPEPGPGRPPRPGQPPPQRRNRTGRARRGHRAGAGDPLQLWCLARLGGPGTRP